jgi:hypothetical protein
VTLPLFFSAYYGSNSTRAKKAHVFKEPCFAFLTLKAIMP